MVPDGRTDGMDGRTHGRRQNYIPPTSSGDNRSMISVGRKHCKYDMHILGSTQHCRVNTINNTDIRQCCFDPTYFHAPFLCIAFKSFIDGKDYCSKCL